jgi:hypothetical protein
MLLPDAACRSEPPQPPGRPPDATRGHFPPVRDAAATPPPCPRAHLAARVGEDDRLRDGQGLVEVAERVQLPVLLLHVDVELLDALKRQLVALHENAHLREDGMVCVCVCVCVCARAHAMLHNGGRPLPHLVLMIVLLCARPGR